MLHLTLQKGSEGMRAASRSGPDQVSVRRTVSSGLRSLDEAQPVGGAVKRAIDIVLGSIALLSLLPLLAIVALLIKLTMGGPVFFAHPRVGYRGRRFPCFKFRTMVQNADKVLQEHLESDPKLRREWQQNQKLAHDPRVPWFGTILRKSSLDELPQLLNVIRGEMSLVGPRPVTPPELERYGRRKNHYMAARPGITGLWQVSGRNSLPYHQRVRIDAAYVDCWSLALDLRVLMRTIPAVCHVRQTS